MIQRTWHILQSNRLLFEVPVARHGGFPPSEIPRVAGLRPPYTIRREDPGFADFDVEFTVNHTPVRRAENLPQYHAEVAAACAEGVPFRLVAAIYGFSRQHVVRIVRKFA